MREEFEPLNAPSLMSGTSQPSRSHQSGEVCGSDGFSSSRKPQGSEHGEPFVHKMIGFVEKAKSTDALTTSGVVITLVVVNIDSPQGIPSLGNFTPALLPQTVLL